MRRLMSIEYTVCVKVFIKGITLQFKQNMLQHSLVFILTKLLFICLQEMDSWYKNKFEDLNNKTTKHVDKVRSVREEIVTAKKDVSINDLSLTCLYWAINL